MQLDQLDIYIYGVAQMHRSRLYSFPHLCQPIADLRPLLPAVTYAYTLGSRQKEEIGILFQAKKTAAPWMETCLDPWMSGFIKKSMRLKVSVRKHTPHNE